MEHKNVITALVFAFAIALSATGCFGCKAGAKQPPLQLFPSHRFHRYLLLNTPPNKSRSLLQLSEVGPLKVVSTMLQRLGLGREGTYTQAAPAETVVQQGSGHLVKLEQGLSQPYVAAVLPSSTTLLQAGTVSEGQLPDSYPSSLTAASSLPTVRYASSVGLGMESAIPGPITQRAGVVGTLIGMAGDTAGQFITDQVAAQAAVVSVPGSPVNTYIANTGAINGELHMGGGHIAGQAVSALGRAGDYATGVTTQIAHNLGAGTGGLFNMAGRFVSTLAQLTGPGRNMATKTGRLEYVSPYSSSYVTHTLPHSGTEVTSYPATGAFPLLSDWQHSSYDNNSPSSITMTSIPMIVSAGQ